MEAYGDWHHAEQRVINDIVNNNGICAISLFFAKWGGC